MKDSQQINYRNRLSNYYRYLFNKAEREEPFQYIKVIRDAQQSYPSQHGGSTSLPSVHDTQRSENIHSGKQIHATIDSYHDKKTRRSSQSPTKLRLPSIHANRRDVTSPQPPLQTPSSPSPPNPSSDWQKYYNVHQLSTVNIDPRTIELMECNQRRAKAHPSSPRG